MSTLNKLENIRKKYGSVAVALIDPDCKNDLILDTLLESINKSNFDAIFIGGSFISDDKFEKRVKHVKMNTDLPVVIFPGSSSQLSKYADALLFLSLISGRNPQFLIGEHVKSAPLIKKINLESIPTAYILLDGGVKSSVEIISNTTPIPMNKHDIILAHALAGEYLGNKFIFLESGSGAKNHAAYEIIEYLCQQISIPIIVGGGVESHKSAKQLAKSGAGYIVAGTKLEINQTVDDLSRFTDAIHYK